MLILCLYIANILTENHIKIISVFYYFKRYFIYGFFWMIFYFIFLLYSFIHIFCMLIFTTLYIAKI